jgi:hypothetical protein
MISPRTLTAHAIKRKRSQKIQHLPALLALAIHTLALLLSLFSALVADCPRPPVSGREPYTSRALRTHSLTRYTTRLRTKRYRLSTIRAQVPQLSRTPLPLASL